MAQHKLSAKRVNSLKKRGHYSDGGNLYLQVSQWQTKSWIFRYRKPGRAKGDGIKIREMGLGPLALVSLAEAREQALTCRKLLLVGRDPIEARKHQRAQALLEAAKAITFKECADNYIKAKEGEWKNARHRGQWRQTLGFACDTIGDLPVAEIDTSLVLKVLEPIWTTTPETASRLRQRIEAVLNWATARGYREGDNPARWKGHLANLLAKTRKLRSVKHHPALPYQEVPVFMAELRANNTIGGRALEFTILTAARTGETLGATWEEIDLRAKAWIIPAERMKTRKEHRVPLTDRALAILSSLPRDDGNPFVFIGGGRRKSLNHVAMLDVLKAMRPGLTVHGFRSSFRDWAAEQTNHPREIAEAALAHILPNAAERAYKRTDLFDKRRRLMAEWARYCERKPIVVESKGRVVGIRR